MRILSVTAQKVDSTGSGVFLTELVKCFEEAGHQQAVICGCTKQDLIRLPERVELFPVYYNTQELPFPVCGMSDEMPYESTRYCDLTDGMTRQLFRAFRKRIRKAVETFRPDVILCHHLYFLAALIRQMYPDIPVYGQCHGSDLRQFRKNPWQRHLISEQIPRLNGIFALHEQQKHQICQTFHIAPEMVTVKGVGYNGNVFFEDAQAKAEKDSRVLRLIFAGKLSEKKGIFSLIRAMSRMPEPEKIELCLAGGYGNSEEYEKICDLAEKAPCQVTFLGKLNQQELARQMNGSDVFVLPSFYEGLPLVLMEAMACGLKTVCTDLPGIQPWLERSIPGNGTVFVEPPMMYNEDEAVHESLPAFEQRIADAIVATAQKPLPDQEKVSLLSWKALAASYCEHWK
ncbi:MAG: glycosyltransferase [Oscillospiraceae bacterium]|nr:glycosyltransferase [Oscillospiraceae bacterium]